MQELFVNMRGGPLLWYISIFYCLFLIPVICGKNTPRARVTNRDVGLVINLHESQFYLLSCMVFYDVPPRGRSLRLCRTWWKNFSRRYLLATLITKLGKFARAPLLFLLPLSAPTVQFYDSTFLEWKGRFLPQHSADKNISSNIGSKNIEGIT